jgi:hypothetical protein
MQVAVVSTGLSSPSKRTQMSQASAARRATRTDRSSTRRRISCTARPSLAGDATRALTLRARASVAGRPPHPAGPSLAGGGAVRVAPIPLASALDGGRA